MRRLLLIILLIGVLIMPTLAIGYFSGLRYGLLAFCYYIVSVIIYSKATTKKGEPVVWLLLFIPIPFLYTLFFIFDGLFTGFLLLLSGIGLLVWSIIRYGQLKREEQALRTWRKIEATYPDDLDKYELKSIVKYDVLPEGATEKIPKNVLFIDLYLEYELEGEKRIGRLQFNHFAELGEEHITADMIKKWQQYPLQVIYNPRNLGELKYYVTEEVTQQNLDSLNNRRRILLMVFSIVILLGIVLIAINLK